MDLMLDHCGFGYGEDFHVDLRAFFGHRFAEVVFRLEADEKHR